MKKALRDWLRDRAKDARQKRVPKSASARRDELRKKQSASTNRPAKKDDKNEWRTALRATGL